MVTWKIWRRFECNEISTCISHVFASTRAAQPPIGPIVIHKYNYIYIYTLYILSRCVTASNLLKLEPFDRKVGQQIDLYMLADDALRLSHLKACDWLARGCEDLDVCRVFCCLFWCIWLDHQPLVGLLFHQTFQVPKLEVLTYISSM